MFNLSEFSDALVGNIDKVLYGSVINVVPKMRYILAASTRSTMPCSSFGNLVLAPFVIVSVCSAMQKGSIKFVLHQHEVVVLAAAPAISAVIT